MSGIDVSKLPAFPHREFTEEEAEKLARMVEEAEKTNKRR